MKSYTSITLRPSLQKYYDDYASDHTCPFRLSRSPEKKGFYRFIKHDGLVENIVPTQYAIHRIMTIYPPSRNSEQLSAKREQRLAQTLTNSY